jgi:predicted RNase H-like HicB family nuclease
MKLLVMMEPCEEGGFHTWVPALPGCHSEGDTEVEAMANIREAIELYLEPDEEELPGPPARRFEVAV